MFVMARLFQKTERVVIFFGQLDRALFAVRRVGEDEHVFDVRVVGFEGVDRVREHGVKVPVRAGEEGVHAVFLYEKAQEPLCFLPFGIEVDHLGVTEPRTNDRNIESPCLY